MVAQDNIVQWLAGDALKRDQFKFMYDMLEIIYQSPLRDLFLDEKKN